VKKTKTMEVRSLVKIKSVKIYRLATFLLLFTTLVACIPILADPYPVDIEVDSETPERGKYSRYTISVKTEENLDIIVSVSHYIPGKGWSGWEDIWEGYLPKTSRTFHRTLYIPEDAEPGSVVIWVIVQYASKEFYGVEKGKRYYLDYGVVYIAGHLPDPEVDYWKNETNYWTEKYHDLENKYHDLEDKYHNLKQKYNILQEEYNTLEEKYDGLVLKYYALFGNYTRLQEKYNDLSNKYLDLKSSYIRLEQERNYIYIALMVLISLALILGGYIYHLKKQLKSLVPSRSEKIIEG